MKKLIPILFVVILFSCKKTEMQPNNIVHEKHGMVTVTINSNYNYPYLNIYRNNLILNPGGGGINNITPICWYNKSESFYNKPVAIKYIINSQDTGSYIVHSYARKNNKDSTLYMLDNKSVWSSMRVVDEYGRVLIDSTSSKVDIVCKFWVK